MHLVADRFDFPVPRNTTAFVCTRVRDGAPVLYVTHDEEGEWQFLCGGDHPDSGEDKPVVVCMECAVARDPSLNELADLGIDTAASRECVGAGWKRLT